MSLTPLASGTLPLLTITTTASVFQTTEPLHIVVGTDKSKTPEAALIQYQHPESFSLRIGPGYGGVWHAEIRDIIVNSHQSFFKAYTEEGMVWSDRLMEGLHTFIFGEAPTDRFSIELASSKKPSSELSLHAGDHVVLKSASQIEMEQGRENTARRGIGTQIFQRINEARTQGDVDGHNLSIILGDLQNFYKGREEDSIPQVFEFAYVRTGKIVGILPIHSGFVRAVWPMDFKLPMAKLIFDPKMRTIQIIVDPSKEKTIPNIVKGFVSVVKLFNEQMGGNLKS